LRRTQRTTRTRQAPGAALVGGLRALQKWLESGTIEATRNNACSRLLAKAV